MAKTVDIIIPVYRPGKDFDRLIEMLVSQSVRPHSIIIMNSVEEDGECSEMNGTAGGMRGNETAGEVTDGALSRERDRSAGQVPDTRQKEKTGCALPGIPEMDIIRVFNIPKSEFDHGHTRNVGVSHSDADYFVCMTQDVVPCDNELLRRLTEAMDESADGTGERVAMAYARQIAKPDASDIEAITRSFNYPGEDMIKTQRDISEMGIKAFFASNVCCCYDRKVFDGLGGFVDRTDFNEDMIYAAGLIRAGYAIKYCAQAAVYHSHNYSARQQYERNRQLAVSQIKHPECFGGIRSESEGVRLVKKTASELVREGRWYRIPELVCMSAAKYIGYRAGRREGRKQ